VNKEDSPVKALYELGAAQRLPFLERARKCSELTIPTLLPKEGSTSATSFPTPYQSLGARGVNHLSAKLLLTLLPPNAPFFKLTLSSELRQELGEEMTKGAIDESMSNAERAVMREIENSATRVQAFEALKHLIVSGNVLMCWPDPDKGRMRVYPLDRYVVYRDPNNNVTEIIIKEGISPMMLPEAAKGLVPNDTNVPDDPDREIDLYTCVKRKKEGGWSVHQEIEGNTVPGSQGFYPDNKTLPWLPLRYDFIDGEDYGRGHIEQYYGDLKSLEQLTKAIVEGSAAASKVLFLVSPNGMTSEQDLAEVPNGGIIPGNANDVSVLQMEKFNDFKIADITIQKISERLSYSFMLNSAIRRDAERVTAQEIRYMAQELESSLGGVFSLLSTSFQLPLVRIILDKLASKGELPPLNDEQVQPQIVTGLEGLGRNDDLNRLTEFLNDINLLSQSEGIQAEMNLNEIIMRVGAARGIEMKGMVKTPEQKQKEQEAAQQAQQQQQFFELLKSASPEIIKQFGGQFGGEQAMQGMQGMPSPNQLS